MTAGYKGTQEFCPRRRRRLTHKQEEQLSSDRLVLLFLLFFLPGWEEERPQPRSCPGSRSARGFWTHAGPSGAPQECPGVAGLLLQLLPPLQPPLLLPSLRFLSLLPHSQARCTRKETVAESTASSDAVARRAHIAGEVWFGSRPGSRTESRVWSGFG